MRKWQKVLGAVFLVIWVGSAIEKAYQSNPRAIEIYEEANPDVKIEYLSSDLNFFHILFTIDHEWTARWEVDGKHERVRWSREFDQLVPLGVYFGMGTAWLSFVEMRNK